jgi:hypothetical protein
VRHSLRSAVLVGLLAVVALALVAGCSSGGSSAKASPAKATADEPWPAPADPLTRARAAGLVPETAERLEHHVHSHLDVYVNGKKILVPGGIGINTKDPGVHSGTVLGQPAYGGISVPCDQPCISPLHTHDASGILHTESATDVDNTLGQFFTEWGVTLSPTCVGTYCEPKTPIAISVDGQRYTGDPRTIPLTNFKEIAIVIGTPPAKVPAEGDFSQI